jgi:biopolymer transport protein ExbD
MKAWLAEVLEEKVELQIAPLIDVVFLLLIYFMVTSSLRKSEADLGITLPGNIELAKTVQMPDEQIIEIDAAGNVMLNSSLFKVEEGRKLPDLVYRLIRYRQASENAKTKALITIQAEDETLHERIVDVMNACAAAGIKHVTFGMGE